MSSTDGVMGSTDQRGYESSYRVRGLAILLAGAVIIAAVLFGLVAGSGAVWNAVTGPSASGPSIASLNGSAMGAAKSTPSGSAAGGSGTAAPSAAIQVRLVVNPAPLGGVKGPDGRVHDAFVPATFTMTAGKTYQVTVLSYGTMPHTWTSPGLGVNGSVPTGSPSKPSVAHFTIQPTKAGTYQWFCATPCDPWSMVHDGFMRGTVTVVA